MYFSRSELSRSAFGRQNNWELATNGYRAHQLAWSLFSDHGDRQRDFIFRWETDGPLPVLYAVSHREPVDTEGVFRRVQTKPYLPKIHAGQRLAFSTRVNPVIKSRDEDGRQRVHDVVMSAKYEARQTRDGSSSPYSQQALIEQRGKEWLKARTTQYGFDFDEDAVLTESYQRHEFRKARGGRPVVISTLDFRGVLTVVEPELFREALLRGIGPSKAFGCGLLLVRPQ